MCIRSAGVQLGNTGALDPCPFQQMSESDLVVVLSLYQKGRFPEMDKE